MNSAAKMQTRDAKLAWNRLSGVVCIYKPPMTSWIQTRKTLFGKLSKELNEMECRPQRPHINIVGDTSKKLIVDVVPSYADHPLAIGPRYIREEFKAMVVKPLNRLISGVCVIGINKGVRTALNLKKINPVSTYRITGQLGILTDDKTSNGNIILRCPSKHIQRHNIDKAAATIEANHTKSLFALTGIHPQSQAAYEMMSQGIFRPVNNNWPVFYSIKCIEMNLPYFTLEVVAVNEEKLHLVDMVHNIGIRLRNSAVTTSIQCIRSTYFSLEDALLKKHWTLQNVIDNMAHCDKILADNRHFSEFLQQVEKEEKAALVPHDYENEMLDEDEEEKMNEKI